MDYYHELVAQTDPKLSVTLVDLYNLFNPILFNPEACEFTSGGDMGCVVGTYGTPNHEICSTDPAVQDTYVFW